MYPTTPFTHGRANKFSKVRLSHFSLDMSPKPFALLVSILATIIAILLFLPSHMTNPATAAVTPVSCSATHTVVTCLDLNVSSSDLSINITPSTSGTHAATSHTLNTKTNAPGYKLFINTLTTDTSLAYQNPTTLVPPPAILATSGTIVSPAVLTTNSWGFAVPGTTGFDSSYASPTPSSTSKWAAVPNTATQIKSTTTANDTTGNDTTIYYGVKLDINQQAGTYATTVVYSVTANPFPSPTITNISPNTGPIAGGTSITITGTNFYDTETVTIGGTACTTFTVNSPTQITCTTPASTAGAKNVVVTTGHGVATSTGGFTYQNPVPTITSICRAGETCTGNTSSGHFRGGETFTITGTLFTGATAVSLGASACRSFTVVSDTQITCLSSGIASSFLNSDNLMTNTTNVVNVNVTAPAGTATGGTGLFTYRYPIASFTNSGTFLNVLTTDVTFGTKLQVASTDCLSPTIISATAMSCTSPTLAAGARALSIVAPPASQGNMQNWTGCSAIATPPWNTTNWATYTRVLTDTRNGQMYRIRKMSDGKCWMIDNLKLGARTGGFTGTLTSTNSNVTANFTLPANPVNTVATRVTNGVCHSSNTAGATGTTGNLTCDGTTSGTTGTPANTNFNFIAWSDPADVANTGGGDSCQPGAPGLDKDSLSGCGYLYNWFTATAGSGTYANASGDVAQSICPSGWRLPSAGTGTATTDNEFAVLNGAMLNGGVADITNSAATRANWRANGPFSGAYSGNWLAGFANQGYYGSYWSSSAGNATNARYLLFYYSGVLPGNNTYAKHIGYAIRCVLN